MTDVLDKLSTLELAMLTRLEETGGFLVYRGPGYDKRLKAVFKLGRYSQTEICTALKRLDKLGLVSVEETADWQPVSFGLSKPKQYPRVAIKRVA